MAWFSRTPPPPPSAELPELLALVREAQHDLGALRQDLQGLGGKVERLERLAMLWKRDLHSEVEHLVQVCDLQQRSMHSEVERLVQTCDVLRRDVHGQVERVLQAGEALRRDLHGQAARQAAKPPGPPKAFTSEDRQRPVAMAEVR
jgi:hypothetical protein